MSAEVLGISGSPLPNSNTDRAVRCVLEATGLTTAFVKLSNLRMEPCRACLACKDTNQCVVQDDAQALSEQFRTAKAFVLGTYVTRKFPAWEGTGNATRWSYSREYTTPVPDTIRVQDRVILWGGMARSKR